MRRYTILPVPDPDEGGYVVDVPALSVCHTQGDTLEEAIANVREAIAGWIESAEKHGEPVPEEETQMQALVIDVAA